MKYAPGSMVKVTVVDHPSLSSKFTHMIWGGYSDMPTHYTTMFVKVLGWDTQCYLAEPPSYCEHFKVEEDVSNSIEKCCGVSASTIVGKRGVWIRFDCITEGYTPEEKRKELNGMACSMACGEFNIYAEPNTTSGDLVCYLCRQDPYRTSLLNVEDF